MFIRSETESLNVLYVVLDLKNLIHVELCELSYPNIYGRPGTIVLPRL